MSELETRKHIKEVEDLLCDFGTRLLSRAIRHDASKLKEPELSIFEVMTPKLKASTYGSDEYKLMLAEMKPALDHHYANNRHHPEHFIRWVCNGCFKEFQKEPMVCDICGYSQFQKEPDVSQMTLMDIVEMFCDWLAATKRHNDGDIYKSIEINKSRFRLSGQLIQILKNTADEIR